MTLAINFPPPLFKGLFLIILTFDKSANFVIPLPKIRASKTFGLFIVERELGEFYVDDLVWVKWDNGVYFKPEYMNKESQGVKYLKMDWRNKWKDWSYGFTSRNSDDNVFSKNFETFFSFGMSKKKKYYDDKIEVDISFDGYFPPSQEDERDTFEFEDKFKVSWKLSDKIRIYNLGEISKLQGTEFYKAKIGLEYTF